jgi:hypothetical protein
LIHDSAFLLGIRKEKERSKNGIGSQSSGGNEARVEYGSNQVERKVILILKLPNKL